MHRIIAEFLKILLTKIGINIDSFILCIITYIIAFFVSFLMCKIPTKLSRELVD